MRKPIYILLAYLSIGCNSPKSSHDAGISITPFPVYNKDRLDIINGDTFNDLSIYFLVDNYTENESNMLFLDSFACANYDSSYLNRYNFSIDFLRVADITTDSFVINHLNQFDLKLDELLICSYEWQKIPSSFKKINLRNLKSIYHAHGGTEFTEFNCK